MVRFLGCSDLGPEDLQQHFCKENLQHTVYLHLFCNGLEKLGAHKITSSAWNKVCKVAWFLRVKGVGWLWAGQASVVPDLVHQQFAHTHGFGLLGRNLAFATFVSRWGKIWGRLSKGDALASGSAVFGVRSPGHAMFPKWVHQREQLSWEFSTADISHQKLGSIVPRICGLPDHDSLVDIGTDILGLQWPFEELYPRIVDC